MSLDLIVVNYKTPGDLNQFLESVATFPPHTRYSLTLVDVESEPTRETTVWGTRIGVAANIGYARACNLGAQAGDGDVIALFNADVQVTEGAIDACYGALQNNLDWGVCGPRQVDTARRIRHAGIFGTEAAPAHRGWNELDVGQHVDIRDAVTVAGSAYFIRRSVWAELTDCPLYRAVAPDAIGAFLPTRHYYEETWCSYHCRRHGYRVVYFGEATMIHKWHQASPIRGWAEAQIGTSHAYFRAACDHHGIAHD